MQLFFITCETDDGDSADLFVSANDRLEALDLWRSWMFDFFNDDNAMPDRVFVVPAPAAAPTIHAWGEPQGVQEA